MKLLLFFMIYLIVSLFILNMYSSNNKCISICEAELLGNILNCSDLDLQCYQYYQNIYNKCIQKC
jgi:hypothetical protein